LTNRLIFLITEDIMGKMKPMKPGGGGMKINRPVMPARPVFAPRPMIAPKPAIRPQVIAPRPTFGQRPTAVAPQRGASQSRVVVREVRREAFKQIANQQQTQPRFGVRPPAPPQKIMARQPVQPNLVRPAATPVGQNRPKTGLPIPPASPVGMVTVAPKPGKFPTPPPILGGKVIGKMPITPQSVRPGFGTAIAGAATTAVLTSLALNTAVAHPQIAMETNSLNTSLESLRDRSSLSQVQTDMNELDSALTHAVNLLESARDKGYIYQQDLDEIAYQAMDRWQGIRQQLQGSIPQQAAAFQSQLNPLGAQVSSLNSMLGNPIAATPMLTNTSSQVNVLLNELGQIESNLQGSFAEIENQAYQLTSRLNSIHWILGQLGEAKFRLADGENLVMAVQARWDQVGDDDPEGILYLSNKRLIYERKEKVATKKVLFITMAQELVQEVLIDQDLTNIKNTKAVNKGIFGHQDFMEVEFSDPKLGVVPFHLNGQSCEDWVNWVQKAKSGEIENDRSTGSGLTLSDLTGLLTTADLMAVQSEVNGLQDVVTLKAVREDLAGTENEVRSLERDLANLRSRGYVIEKSLEADIAILATQWDRIKSNAETTLEGQTRLLSEQMTSIQKTMADLMGLSNNLNAARPLYMQIKSGIASAEAQADAADDTVIATYDNYADEVEAMSSHLQWVGWMLDALATASFQLLATESGVAATEAIWERPGFTPENGIIFQTDQRLLWEDRVDTFELKFDQPLQQITEVQKEVDEATGQEFLVFNLNAGGPYPSVRFAMALPVADAWLKIVGRARTGEYTRDRAVEIDPAELERIRNAPNQCSNCGAALTSPILRGQTDIACEYCGKVTRI
jgi:hypothetical protein